MRKFVSLLPMILAFVTAIYGAFDHSVFSFVTGHSYAAAAFAAAYAASEALASTSVIKANSVAEAVFDAVLSLLRLVLHKQPATA